ncbi:MAG: preprotein translocase subunit SecE [Chloroflexi bacterium]|nr:preprotein translocase subunit SecE [Chloroflexota bacterium]
MRRSLRQGTPEASRSRESFQFFRETIAELRRVVWPTREQATRLTILVIAISISVGIILGVMDMLFGRLFRLLI